MNNGDLENIFWKFIEQRKKQFQIMQSLHLKMKNSEKMLLFSQKLTLFF